MVESPVPDGYDSLESEEYRMNNKGVGAVFCLIAAILMVARYLSAAIFMSSTPTWSAEHFSDALSYVGAPLRIAAICALVVGAVFLIFGIVQDRKKDQ